MSVDPLNVWKKTHAELDKITDPTWSMNFASWYEERIQKIQTNSLALTTTSFVFKFQKATFAASLSSLMAVTDAKSGLSGFVNAWMSAIPLTIFPAFLNVGAGSYVGSPSPATTFSVVSSVLIDPASIAAAQSKLMELLNVVPVADPMESQMPVKFFEATMQLKINVTGMSSIPPPAGPLPLMAMQVPLI